MSFRRPNLFFIIICILSFTLLACSGDDDNGDSRVVIGSVAGVNNRWTGVEFVENPSSFTIKTDCFLGSGVRLRFPKEPGTYIPGETGLLKMQARIHSENEKECSNLVEPTAEPDFGYLKLNSVDGGVLRGEFIFRVWNPAARYASGEFTIAY